MIYIKQTITIIQTLPLLIITTIMGPFFKLAVALATITGSFASPVVNNNGIAERGPEDFVLKRINDTLSRRQSAPSYHQDYTTGGTVTYTPTGSSFTTNWNTQDDFVVGIGWNTGADL